MNKCTRFICLLLVMCLLLAVPVSAETVAEPRASAFFSSHDAYLYKIDTRTFAICFDVTANATRMQELGVSSIEIDRSADGVNWTLVKTYDAEDYSEMICENTGSHTGYVTYYNATPSCYYRAYVTFYAKNSTGSAKLYRYTTVLQM